ncbi:MAG: FG-GAP and VCBS repeat-containing protein, partial [Polyangiaceae bacterium]
DQFQLTRVDVDSDNPIDSAPLLVDVNNDGHLDVLVSVSGFAFVSYSDGSTLGPAERYLLEVANVEAPEPVDVPMPVAAGDFTADGFIDFVFFNYLLLSSPTPNDPRPTYRNDYGNQGAGWTAAQIVDLNGNGKLDVIAGGSDRLNLDFFNGTGEEYVVPGVVTTSGPVSHIAVGDYDGDLIQDVAFVELARSAGQPDTVKIAYGAAAGPPSAPIAAARVQAINGINTYTEFGISFMIVDSAETHSSGARDAVITLLETAGDRMPLAAYTLSTFSETGSTQAANALALAAGHFRSNRSSDVLALGTDEPFGSGIAFWLVPDILSTSSSPIRLSDLPLTLQPISISGASVSVMAAGITVDLDGDGRDESVWLMPYRSDMPPPGVDFADEQCALLVVRTPAEGELPVLDEPIVLEERCTSPALLAADADGDGHPDLVVLTGDAEGQLASKLELPLEVSGGESPGKKQLSILWNDGQGGFNRDQSALVSAAEDSPLAFTTLPFTAQQPFRLAYVTSDAVRLVNASTFPRALGAPTTLAEISGGTSIVAGDVDGDGIVDLAVAAAGDVQIVRAGLAP